MNVSGKTAIVFGGTSGIGLATCERLCRLGAQKVYAVSRQPKKIQFEHPNIVPIAVDVLQEDALQSFFARTGNIDILVSSATGGKRALGPFLDMDMQGYKDSFAKLWGYAHVVRYGCAYVKPNGCIVLVSGSPAKHCKEGQIALSSVGSAVEAFARGIAKEIAPIRINVVSPGIIDTPMVSHVHGDARTQYYQRVVQNHLIPRPGTADEVAKGIVFAIENDFITGTTIDVDGGFLLSP